ncbi:MAG: CmcI family methyltransferase [Fimbriimonadaceae bacterium]
MRFGLSEKRVVDEFHKLYYNARKHQRTLGNTHFLGVPAQKCPLDLWVYQEILFEIRPDLVIETGTADGGSALYLASLMELVGTGEIVSIDIESREMRPKHSRIRYLLGSSTDSAILAEVGEIAAKAKTVLAILDSDHSRDHVLDELRAYGPLVTPGSYLIVEDTNVNGHPVRRDHGPGPMEAVDEFLRSGQPFEIDESREKFFLTFNPRGYLRRNS